MTVKDLLNAEDGTPVTPGCKAQVKFSDPIVSSAAGSKTEWSFMPLKVEDASGVVKVLWWSPPEGVTPQMLKGKMVAFKASKNGKGVLSGAIVQHRPNSKTGANEISVSVNAMNLWVEGMEFDGQAPLAGFAGGQAPQAVASGAPASSAAHTAVKPQVTLLNVLSDGQLLRAMIAWATQIRTALAPHLEAQEAAETVPYEVVGTCLNTLVIAATQGRLTLDPVPSDFTKPKAKEEEQPTLPAPDESWMDADIPFGWLLALISFAAMAVGA